MSGVRLRVLTPADAAAIARLHQAATGEGWPAGSWGVLLADPLSLGFAAEADGTTAGLALLRVVAGEAEVLMLAVDPAFRRRGIAAALLAQGLSAGRARGAGRAYLEVRHDNAAAISLYRAAGFVDAGRRTGYYATADGRRDALIMARDLVDAPPAGS